MTFAKKNKKSIVLILFCIFLIVNAFAENETDEFLPIIEGEELIVRSKRNFNTETISDKDIERFASDDFSSLLQTAFNLALRNSGGYGTVQDLSVRGFTSDRLNVYIDGFLANSDQSGEFDFNSINPNTVEKVEIDYNAGPGASLFITTKKNTANKVSFSLTASNTSNIPASTIQNVIDTQKVSFSLSGANAKTQWTVNGFSAQAQNHFSYTKNNVQTLYRTGNEIKDGGAQASVRFFLPAYSLLHVNASFFTADKNHSGPISGPSKAKQTIVLTRENVLLDIGHIGNTKLSNQFQASHTFSKTRWDDLLVNSLHTLHTLNFSNKLLYTPSSKNEFSFETTVRNTVLSSTNTSSVIQTRSLTKGEIKGTSESAVSWKGSLSIPIEHTPKQTRSAELPQILLPSIALSVPTGDTSTVSFSIYRAYNLSDLQDTHWSNDATAKGNKDLKAETGWGGDVLFSIVPSQTLSVSVSAFTVFYRDAILWQVSNTIWSPENIGKALYAGSDLKFNYSPANKTNFSVSYGFLQTWLLTGSNTLASNKRIPYQPMHRLLIDSTTSFDDSSISATLRYESARYTGVVNTEALNSFFVLDARITKKIHQAITVFFNAENLFAETYETMLGYPSPALQLTTGCKIELDL